MDHRNRMHGTAARRHLRGGRTARALFVTAAFGLAGCDSLLDVENPNNVLEDDLREPSSANAVVNGALSTVARAVSNALRGHEALTDEYDWVGSWNSAGELEQGLLSNNANDFTNTAFNDLSVARWLSDEAIELLEGFEADGTLESRTDLARAYLYSAIAYMTIADMYDDFTFSDRQEAGPPVGEDQMHTLYDIALERLGAARAVAEAEDDAALVLTTTALEARAHWAKALWQKLNPKGAVPADPLIDDANANAAAEAVLAATSADPDWKFRFAYSAATIANTAGAWFNDRQEMVVGAAYGTPDESGKRLGQLTLLDPVDAVPDPALAAIIDEFVAGHEYPPVTVVGVREMHLILAEAALANDDTDAAVDHMNHVRALTEGLTPYDPAIHTSVTPLGMLRHLRRVNLFLQVQRRLGDLYRFDIVVGDWIPGSEALESPGTFFPIGEEERLSNCYIVGTC